jgi:hypothetical protein
MKSRKAYVEPVFEKRQKLSDVTEQGPTVTGAGKG